MVRAYNKTETYSIGKGFMLDITETHDDYEAWVWMEGMGVKEFFYGKRKDTTTHDTFVDDALKLYTTFAEKYRKAYA